MITYDAWTWIWRLNLQLVAFRLSTLSYYVLQGWEFTNTTTSFRNQFRCYLSYRLKVDIVHSITMGLHFWLHAQATKVFKLSNKFLIPKWSASKWTACGSPTISSLQYSELQPPFKGCRHLLLSCGCFQAVLKSRASVFFLLTYCLHLKEFLLFFYTSTIYRISRSPRGTLYRCLGFPLELPFWSQFAAFCLNCI